MKHQRYFVVLLALLAAGCAPSSPTTELQPGEGETLVKYHVPGMS